MAQNVVDFSGNPSGSGLMDDYLDKDQQNVLTSNSGIQRPSYAVAGTKWLDTSVTPWLWKMYDGTNDVTLGTVNPSTHLFTPATPLTTAGDILVQGADGNLSKLAAGVAGTVLTANGAGALPSYQVNPIGILTYSSSYTYKKNDIVVSTNEYDETALYKSLVDSNVGNDLTDETKWEKLLLGGGGNPIGTIGYTTRTDVPNGGAWCDGAEYTQAQFPDVYQMLVDGKLSSTDYSIFNNSVSTNGYCALFALDSSAQKFKVPKLLDKYVMDLADDVPVVGNGMALGISGKDSGIVTRYLLSGPAYPSQDRGGLLCTSSVNGLVGDTSSEDNFTGNTLVGLTTDPEKSGMIADTSNLGKTVTLKAYVVLYSSVAGASEVQAAEFIQGLSGKANVGLDNVTPVQSFKDMSVGWGMPDYGAEVTGLTMPYTAVADGYIKPTASINKYMKFKIGNSEDFVVNSSYWADQSLFPISKGETVIKTEGDFLQMSFIPCKGVN